MAMGAKTRDKVKVTESPNHIECIRCGKWEHNA